MLPTTGKIRLKEVTYSYAIFWICSLVLSSHLLLGFSGDIFPSGFSTKVLYAPLLLPPLTCHMLMNSIILHLIARSTFFESWSREAPHCAVFCSPSVVSSLFDPNVFLKTIFTNTLSLFSSLSVRHQVWQSYTRKITGNTILLHVQIFRLLN